MRARGCVTRALSAGVSKPRIYDGHLNVRPEKGTHLDVYHVGVFAARNSFTWWARNFYTGLSSPSARSRARMRESPLTRVELRCHCSRDSTISRFLATLYQVCRHYVPSEMENISQRGDIAEGVLNITRAEFSPMSASHKYAKLSLQKYARRGLLVIHDFRCD